MVQKCAFAVGGRVAGAARAVRGGAAAGAPVEGRVPAVHVSILLISQVDFGASQREIDFSLLLGYWKWVRFHSVSGLRG